MSKIARQTEGEFGLCYWNVSEKVRRHGGTMILGWQIMYWPGLYVEALHHAVWEDPAGKRFDLTPTCSTDTSQQTTFVADQSLQVDLDCPTFIPSPRYVLKDVKAVRNLLRLGEEQLDHQRWLVAALIEAGATWEPQSGLHANQDLLDRFRAELQRKDEFRNRIGAAVRACQALSP